MGDVLSKTARGQRPAGCEGQLPVGRENDGAGGGQPRKREGPADRMPGMLGHDQGPDDRKRKRTRESHHGAPDGCPRQEPPQVLTQHPRRDRDAHHSDPEPEPAQKARLARCHSDEMTDEHGLSRLVVVAWIVGLWSWFRSAGR